MVATGTRPQHHPILQPDETDWSWWIVTNGTDVKICLAKQKETAKGTVTNRYWDAGFRYRVKTGSQVVNMADEDLRPRGHLVLQRHDTRGGRTTGTP